MADNSYILVDVFGEVVAAVKAALALPVLNYQFGYVRELNETLKQWSATPAFAAQKYPLVWLAQPFTIEKDATGQYDGTVNDLRVFIVVGSSADYKAAQRMEINYKPIIYPIYTELLNQLNSHTAISYEANGRAHTWTDRYWWGEEQQAILNDVVDCGIVERLSIQLHKKQDCKPFTNL